MVVLHFPPRLRVVSSDLDKQYVELEKQQQLIREQRKIIKEKPPNGK
jgi:hypothetical protein